MISIWFFIGLSLLVNGVLILFAGINEIWHPSSLQAQTQLFNLQVTAHATVCWGALMTVIGAWYCYHFKPGRKKA
ncbi:MAG: hypothetical protein ACRD51_02130 [Candidatus Acidiferrum sp.]